MIPQLLQWIKIHPEIALFVERRTRNLETTLKLALREKDKTTSTCCLKKTLAKTYIKASGKKETCPKCGGKFVRLDTHWRVSATCKDYVPYPTTESPLAHAPHSEPSPTPCNVPSLNINNQNSSNTIDLLPRITLPTQSSDWQKADIFFKELKSSSNDYKGK